MTEVLDDALGLEREERLVRHDHDFGGGNAVARLVNRRNRIAHGGWWDRQDLCGLLVRQPLERHQQNGLPVA